MPTWVGVTPDHGRKHILSIHRVSWQVFGKTRAGYTINDSFRLTDFWGVAGISMSSFAWLISIIKYTGERLLEARGFTRRGNTHSRRLSGHWKGSQPELQRLRGARPR